MSRYRTIIAFLIAPLPIPILLSAGLQALDFADKSPPPSLIGFLEGILFFSIFALPQAYISELALGVPAWLVIRHYGIRAWSVFAIGGAVLGMAYYVVYDVARYVAAEAFAFEFVRHEHTRDAQRGKEKPQLFLYDVTSSYLEGDHNAFGAYGYGRDGKKNKKQIVIGLLCDAQGEPVSVEVFRGNTQDTQTFAAQVNKASE